jgi:hypothetical protein
MALSGVACTQGRWPVAIFYAFGHPTPNAYLKIYIKIQILIVSISTCLENFVWSLFFHYHRQGVPMAMAMATIVWQGVAMDSLKYHQGPPCPTLLRPAGVTLKGWFACRAGSLWPCCTSMSIAQWPALKAGGLHRKISVFHLFNWPPF